MIARIIGLYDEGAIVSTPLVGAKGFSVVVEIGDSKIMFDTGRVGRYLMTNMMHLDLKADSISKVVFSHGDKEYTGGLNGFLKDRETPVEVMYPSSAEGSKTMFGHKGVYVAPENSEKAILVTTEGWTEIVEGLHLSPAMRSGDGIEESFMVLTVKKGPVVISACSSCGVDKIMDAVKERFGKDPVAYFGGVSIRKKEKAKASFIAKEFSSRGCNDLHLNHTTGIEGMMYLRMDLGLRGVEDFFVGSVSEYEV